ncbi:MAG: hypothetical protein K0A89_02465 [ANME-2 cluster archaeon]|nr:hypothetical protein [ANME-2 cluster archaeon]
MLETYHLLSLTFNILSIILGLLGLVFVVKNWIVWQKTSVDIIKARAFLDKRFLERNWLYLVIVGGIIIFRRMYRLAVLYQYKFVYMGPGEVVFDFLGFVVIFILVTMAYQWYKIIQSHA